MAARKRSKDGSRDTDKVLGPTGGIAQQGRKGGRLARDIGTEDEKKRATERPAGQPRVTKSHEKEDGDA